MKRWHDKSPAELERDENFLLAYRDWERQMLRAVRAGLVDYHPAVYAFVQTRRSLGSGRLLRRARRGVEKGVGQFDSEDVHLRDVILAAIKGYELQYNRRPTQQRIRQILIANKISRCLSKLSTKRSKGFSCSVTSDADEDHDTPSRQPDLSEIVI
jgi:hypothetical protein